MWGRGRRRKKKEVGRLGCSCHCNQSPAFLGTLGGMWKGEKRQLKPVGIGPIPHPHPGHWGQLYPFCWTKLDRAPWASWAIPWLFSVPIYPGMPWEWYLCAPVVETLMSFPLHSSYSPPESVSSLPTSSRVSGLGISKCQNFSSLPD